MTLSEDTRLNHGETAHNRHFVLALHGFAGLVSDFEQLKCTLTSELSLAWTVPPLPFHELRRPDSGDAGAPGEIETDAFDSSQWAQALVRFQVMPRSREPWILLGYSMGARLALHVLAASQMLKCPPAGIVLVSGSPGLADPRQREERAAVDRARARALVELGTLSFLEQWDRQPLLASQTAALGSVAELRRAERAKYEARCLARALVELSPGRLAEMGAVSRQYPGPVLLVTGAQDEKYDAIARAWLPTLRLGCHQVVSGGHAPHVECPDELARCIENWVALCAPVPTRA